MLLEPALSPPKMRVANFAFGANELYQEAVATELRINILPNGCCEVSLTMERSLFELLAAGTAGAAVPAAYSKPGPVTVTGNSYCAVDLDGRPRYRLLHETVPAYGTVPAVPGLALNVATGHPETFAAGQDWRGFLDAQPDAYYLQDRYLGEQFARAQLNLHDMTSLYLRMADAAPSAFALPL